MIPVAITLAVLMLVGIPIAFVFGMAGVAGLLSERFDLINLPQRMFFGVDQFVLMAAPFYILAGDLMNRGGITDRLIHLSIILVGRIRGGTAYATVISSILFAGISGTAIADMAALGKVFIRGMPKEGYTKEFAAAVTCAGSIIGPIIPPSVIMVLYASMVNISPLPLFLGGVVPGLLLGGACALIVAFKGRGGRLPRSSVTVERAAVPRLVIDGILVASLPAMIVGGTMSGAFTATEAGGIAVAYAALIGAYVFKDLTWQSLMESLQGAARMTASVFFLIACANIVTYIMVLGGIAEWTANLVNVFKGQPQLFLVACIIAFLIIGCFLDAGAALLIGAPFLLPIARGMGIDDTHFSIIMIVAVTLGLITPPVGLCLFVACKIADTTMGKLLKEMWPFIVAEIAVVFVLVFFPVLTTGLPKLLLGR